VTFSGAAVVLRTWLRGPGFRRNYSGALDTTRRPARQRGRPGRERQASYAGATTINPLGPKVSTFEIRSIAG